MPHISIKGLEESYVEKASETLTASVASAVGCPEGDVLVQYCPVQFYAHGKPDKAHPVIVQIDTQPREKAVLDKFAGVVTSTLRNYTNRSIDVFFICNTIDLYYHSAGSI